MNDDQPERLLERRALRIEQNSHMPLYLFALAADEVALVADVARISRDEAGKLIGYQRPERRSHVKQILDYLNSGEVLFPNGLILALPDTVRFRSSRGPGHHRWPGNRRHPRDPAPESATTSRDRHGLSTVSNAALRSRAPRTPDCPSPSPASSHRPWKCNGTSSCG